MKRPGISAIIFDVDGVLFDSEGLHVKAWEKVFGPRGIVLWEREYYAGVGVPDREFLISLREQGRLPADLDIPRIMREKFEAFASIADGKKAVFPGVPEAVRRLAERYLLCAASNSNREVVRRMIETAGFADCFKAVLGYGDAENAKPAPDIYLLAAERLGVGPAACVVVEDSAIGVAAAKAAGMFCVAIGHSMSPGELAACDVFLQELTLAGLEEALERATRSTPSTGSAPPAPPR